MAQWIWRGGKSWDGGFDIRVTRAGEDYWRSIRGVDEEFSYRGQMIVSISYALRGQAGWRTGGITTCRQRPNRYSKTSASGEQEGSARGCEGKLVGRGGCSEHDRVDRMS